MILTSEEINAGCEAARDRYLAMGMRIASLTFAYELQGFISAQVSRGHSFESAVDQVNALIKLLNKANS